ncbi:MAG TPA: aldo/keto reductase [bacterium]|nr:aldo/keto reductase [bacterium]
MHYRRFGHTGLFVSELSLGSMTFGGRGFWTSIGQLGAAEAQTFIGTALDAGVNLIDTADVYSEGESERLVGEALAALKRPRHEILVATKCRGKSGPGLNDVGLSRSHILDSINGSLHRLKLDHVDLYQIHGFDAETPLEETVRALDDVVRSGKARYVGFCNLQAWQAMKALDIAQAEGLSRFVSAQVYYSIGGRDIEREIVPFCQDQGLAILPWSPLAGGLFTGKYDLEHPGPHGARRTSFDFPPVDKPRAKGILQALREVAQETAAPVSRVALAWLLSKPYVTSVIVGARTKGQLDDNLLATDLTLTFGQNAKLDDASALPPEYPGWMLARQAGERAPAAARI